MQYLKSLNADLIICVDSVDRSDVLSIYIYIYIYIYEYLVFKHSFSVSLFGVSDCIFVISQTKDHKGEGSRKN